MADLRAPTPSAAAELAVPSAEELLEKFAETELRLRNAVKRNIENRKLLLKVYSDKQVLKDPISKINEKGIYIDHLGKLLENAALNIFAKKQQSMGIMSSKLDGLSPLGTLGRGYSLAKKTDGKLVRSISDVTNGDQLSIIVHDGTITAEVK